MGALWIKCAATDALGVRALHTPAGRLVRATHTLNCEQQNVNLVDRFFERVSRSAPPPSVVRVNAHSRRFFAHFFCRSRARSCAPHFAIDTHSNASRNSKL